MIKIPAYKHPKRNSWYCAFWYTDFDGVRRKKKKEGFKTKREALDFERDFLANQTSTADLTFAGLYNIYMADCETRLRGTTVEAKKWVFESKILPTFGSTRIKDITPAMVRRWQNKLMDDKADYSQTYLKTINTQLSAIMNYAVRFYGLSKNPVTLCGPFGKGKADEMLFWTREEFGRFIAEVKKPAARLAFEVLFWTGMREGELLALTLNDVDFINSKISITKSLGKIKGEWVINPPKTPKSNRTISVPRFLLALIKDYADRLYEYDPSDRLFYFSKYLLGDEIKARSEAAGVKTIRVHDLRHSHSSFLINMNVPILLISHRLGHENIETTLRTYSHLYPEKQQEMINQMEQSESENYSEVLSDFESKISDIK